MSCQMTLDLPSYAHLDGFSPQRIISPMAVKDLRTVKRDLNFVKICGTKLKQIQR